MGECLFALVGVLPAVAAPTAPRGPHRAADNDTRTNTVISADHPAAMPRRMTGPRSG